MAGKKKKPVKSWSMRPSLHDQVSDILAKDNLEFEFFDNDDPESCTKEYDTAIKGWFNCRNKSCSSTGWPSMTIAITIRMYPHREYNARVYHQRCESCNHLSKPVLDNSYAERVAYRLKKWCGIEMEPPQYSGKSKGPHQRELCEGCRIGRCREARM